MAPDRVVLHDDLANVCPRCRVAAQDDVVLRALDVHLHDLYLTTRVLDGLVERRRGDRDLVAEALRCGQPVVAARVAAVDEREHAGLTGHRTGVDGDPRPQVVGPDVARDVAGAGRRGLVDVDAGLRQGAGQRQRERADLAADVEDGGVAVDAGAELVEPVGVVGEDLVEREPGAVGVGRHHGQAVAHPVGDLVRPPLGLRQGEVEEHPREVAVRRDGLAHAFAEVGGAAVGLHEAAPDLVSSRRGGGCVAEVGAFVLRRSNSIIATTLRATTVQMLRS